MEKEDRLVTTFVALADTLVADFDVGEYLRMMTERCADALEVEQAGLIVATPQGELEVVAASSEQVRLLLLMQLENGEGPSLDAYTGTGRVTCGDLRLETDRWPIFAPAALASGVVSVLAIPMRLRDQVIGAITLFSPLPGEPAEPRVRLGQAIVDVATIGLLHQRTMQERQALVEQLQTALTSRILIEQAKGVIAERSRVGMEEAFRTLRGYARSHRRKLAEVAQAVIEGSPSVADLFTRPPR
ncbi:GAF and ANTAR domain-containing protein [Spongiactinospora sp. TRM90649]|uniref:GAF and ANTAR domain-containing protein n=1 Tax=Spongiactinospora sp. TRM90649 TaxID=3031114 RepID=UPI0023F62F9F|nr:GAF and ANTAR domain-containing protein [Spongiactinospora sp. TRM90649]